MAEQSSQCDDNGVRFFIFTQKKETKRICIQQNKEVLFLKFQ